MKNTFLLASLFLICCYSPIFGQKSLSVFGNITMQNSDNTPVAGAKVSILKSDTALTDANGEFELIVTGFNTGDKAFMHVQKDGFEVVNKANQRLMLIQGTELKPHFYMTRAGHFIEFVASIDSIIKRNILTRFNIQVQNLSERELGDSISMLKRHKKLAVDMASFLAYEFAQLNTDDQPEDIKNILNQIFNANIKTAYALINTTDLDLDLEMVGDDYKKMREDTMPSNNSELLDVAEKTKQKAALLYTLKARLAVASLQLDSAFLFYKKANQTAPLDVLLAYEYAEFLYLNHMPDKAGELLERAAYGLSSDYRRCHVFYRLGQIFYAKNNYKKSGINLKNSLAIAELNNGKHEVFPQILFAKVYLTLAKTYKQLVLDDPQDGFYAEGKLYTSQAYKILMEIQAHPFSRQNLAESIALNEFFENKTVAIIQKEKSKAYAEQERAKAKKIIEEYGDIELAKSAFQSSIDTYEKSIKSTGSLEDKYTVSFLYEELNLVEKLADKKIANETIAIRYRNEALRLTNDNDIRVQLAQSNFKMAWYNIQAQLFEDAEKYTQKGLTLRPSESQYAEYLAIAAVYLGEWDKATEIYKGLRAKTFYNEEFRVTHLSKYDDLENDGLPAVDRARLKDLVYGEDDYLVRHRQKGKDLLESAQSLEQQGIYESAKMIYSEAVEVFKEIMDKYPDAENGHNLSLAYELYNKLEYNNKIRVKVQKEVLELRKQAYSKQTDVVDVKQSYGIANANMSWYLVLEGEGKQGMNFAKKALELAPLDPLVNKYYCLALANVNKVTKAVEVYESFRGSPLGVTTFEKSIVNDIDTLEKRGIFTEGIYTLKKNLSNTQIILTEAQEYYVLGNQLVYLGGSTREARAYYKTAIQLYNKLIEQSGDIIYKLHLSNALEALNKIETNNVIRLENEEKVLKIRTKAKKVFPENDLLKVELAKSHGNMALYQLFNKDYKKALKHAETGLKLDKTQLWINGHKAFAYLYMGETDKARQLFYKYKNVVWGDSYLKDLFVRYFEIFETAGMDAPEAVTIKLYLTQ